ncbi:protein rolling protein [Citrus sinensis]|uniref:Protein rolling protein n=1 Tax=Citrus sinensis TaxID=2711 RepID=A0ACB8MMY0_CITSI|nr:protein rolling protein [Citrus sinensis]
MALVVYWYDFICFGIVVAAYIGSLWILWRKEGASRCDDNTIYESLLAAQADGDGFVRATHKAHVGSNQLWSSCWKRVHPGCLLLTRFLSFVAMAVFLSWDILDWDASIFIYYTDNGKNTHLPNQEQQKSSCVTMPTDNCVIPLGTVISAYGCWVYTKGHPSANGVRYEILKRYMEENIITNGMTYREKETKGNIKLQSHYVEEEIQQRAGFWGYLMQTVYQTCGGAVLLTDIVFWCVIVPFLSDAHLGLNTLIACMHTLNAVFLLLDTALNSLLLNYHLALQPFPWFRIAYFIQWSCLYCVFQWVIHACGFTWWPYPFLELDTPWAPLWYFVLALVHIPCYGLYVLIVEAKNSILPTLFPRAFIRSY